LNIDPFAGEHDICVGGVPPLDVTDGYSTGIAKPVFDGSTWSAGHAICSAGTDGAGVGGVGAVELDEQPAAKITIAIHPSGTRLEEETETHGMSRFTHIALDKEAGLTIGVALARPLGR
jgi:hypothetical protein